MSKPAATLPTLASAHQAKAAKIVFNEACARIHTLECVSHWGSAAFNPWPSRPHRGVLLTSPLLAPSPGCSQPLTHAWPGCAGTAVPAQAVQPPLAGAGPRHPCPCGSCGESHTAEGLYPCCLEGRPALPTPACSRPQAARASTALAGLSTALFLMLICLSSLLLDAAFQPMRAVTCRRPSRTQGVHSYDTASGS